MRKEFVIARISVHYIQARILDGLKCGKIHFGKDSLRGIASKVGIEASPQKVKHHLEQLLKLGAIDKVGGEYRFAALDGQGKDKLSQKE